jgi:xanthine/CO dehydrogenase XdhC/CoxF family maturation factor
MASTKKRTLVEVVRARSGQPDRVRTQAKLAAEGFEFGKVEGSEVRAEVFSRTANTGMSGFPPQGKKGVMRGVAGRGKTG